ncbi:MAG: putative RNA-binding Zn ribbon-like protein [Myxococcota bacterium]
MAGSIDLVHAATASQSEIRQTIEMTIEMANSLAVPSVDVRPLLIAASFMRADHASAASISRIANRVSELLPLLRALPDLDPMEAAAQVNEQLTELTISPAIAAHHGAGPHLHWTPATAAFDDQVITDILMALAQEVCDNGTERFGTCPASDCGDLFYDGTRNRSKRFCDDPKCSSRTHTAEHRARIRATITEPAS